MTKTAPKRPAEGALARFLRDRRGNVLIITTFLLPAFVVCAGIAVDFTLAYRSRASMQQSLDAAALAAAKMYGTTQNAADLEKIAASYFNANNTSTNGNDAGDGTVFKYDGISSVDGLNVLQVSATKDKPTFFGAAIKSLTGGKVDFTKIHLAESSRIIIENKSIELALVLDNSGSMKDAPDVGGGSAKITTLKNAMTDLAKQMMAKNSGSSSNSANAVKIGIVPFSSAVNVGPSHEDDSWMDTKGWSSIHHDNLDWSNWKVTGLPGAQVPGAVAVPILATGRNAWKSTLTGEWLTREYVRDNAKYGGSSILPAWEGCVESRPNGLAFTDDDATELKPDSLFVEEFAPDEPNDRYVAYPNSYLDDAGGTSGIQRQRDVRKYLSPANRGYVDEDNGPDYGCATAPLTPLTTTLGTVTANIAKMAPKGATNIPEGMAWGWRVLSAKAPFTEGKAANAKDNIKLLILVTDGENTYYPSYSDGTPYNYTNDNKSMYGTYGFGQVWSADGGTASPGHIFDGLATAKGTSGSFYYNAMNEMMGKVCTNIKNDGKSYRTDGSDGIIVATIAFDLPDGSKVKTLLQNCASKGMDGRSAPLYYDAKKSSDLVDAINKIVGQVSALRIYR